MTQLLPVDDSQSLSSASMPSEVHPATPTSSAMMPEIPLNLLLHDAEQTYSSLPPNVDESKDDADLSSSPLEKHECLLPSYGTEIGGFMTRQWEACPFAHPHTTISGPPSEHWYIFEVDPTDVGESGGLQRQPPMSSPEDGVKPIESDQIAALIHPFCSNSLLFKAESMQFIMLPQGEAVENNAVYGTEDNDDNASVSFLHFLSERSIDKGVDKSFAYPDDTFQSSDLALYSLSNSLCFLTLSHTTQSILAEDNEVFLDASTPLEHARLKETPLQDTHKPPAEDAR